MNAVRTGITNNTARLPVRKGVAQAGIPNVPFDSR
jgi:hypothetical protein